MKENKNNNLLNWLTILLASIALVISMKSCQLSLKSNEIALESKKYSEELQSKQIWREKLSKLAQISKNLEDNIFYLKTNMPENENCRKEYLGIITEAEKTIKFVNSHYNYVKDSTSNSNAIDIELSMPEIDRLYIETSQLEEKAKNTVKFCKENHSTNNSK